MTFVLITRYNYEGGHVYGVYDDVELALKDRDTLKEMSRFDEVEIYEVPMNVLLLEEEGFHRENKYQRIPV